MLTLEEAKSIQNQLKTQVIRVDTFEKINYLIGVDVGFQDNYSISKAAAVVLSFPDLELVESSIAYLPTDFDYIPGFLSFREVPVILKALDCLSSPLDLIFCDGQGIAHPRRFGIACHLGVLLDVPTIGVAKSLLIGKHQSLTLVKGNCQPLTDNNEIIGSVLCTRNQVKPVYVSIGHRISLETALDYVLASTTKYRLPEPTRLADKLSKKISLNSNGSFSYKPNSGYVGIDSFTYQDTNGSLTSNSATVSFNITIPHVPM
jgi:deoxyribonuclease V